MTPEKADTGYTYKVLIPQPPSAEAFALGTGELHYKSLGEHKGRTPELAIEAAAERFGLGHASNIAVAVPVNRWHECDVVAEQRTEFTVSRRTPGEGEPINAAPDDPPPSDD
jgi:hypothetical protein